MAFLLQSMDVGQTPPIEYRQATAEEWSWARPW